MNDLVIGSLEIPNRWTLWMWWWVEATTSTFEWVKFASASRVSKPQWDESGVCIDGRHRQHNSGLSSMSSLETIIWMRVCLIINHYIQLFMDGHCMWCNRIVWHISYWSDVVIMCPNKTKRRRVRGMWRWRRRVWVTTISNSVWFSSSMQRWALDLCPVSHISSWIKSNSELLQEIISARVLYWIVLHTHSSVITQYYGSALLLHIF